MLDWQSEQWGVRGPAGPLPFIVQAGGSRESYPRTWQPQVGFVFCHHGSCRTKLPLSFSIRAKQQADSSVHVCPHISISICACVHHHSCAPINVINSF